MSGTRAASSLPAPPAAAGPPAPPAAPASTSLRIVAVSDTHDKHWRLVPDKMPRGDVLVHCGDIFFKSRKCETLEQFLPYIEDFNKWLGAVRPRYPKGIVVIAGNHDVWLERLGKVHVQQLLTNATYLEFDATVIDGVTFYGCPVSWGRSNNRAFQELKFDVRRAMPDYVDVLVSHASWGHPYWKKVLDSGVHVSEHGHIGPYRASERDRGQLLPKVTRCALNISGHDHDLYGACLVTQLRCDARVAARVGLQPEPCDAPMPRIVGLTRNPALDKKLQAAHHYDELRLGRRAQAPGAVDFSTVCVVASTLDLYYKPVNAPVEIEFPLSLACPFPPPAIVPPTAPAVAPERKAK